MNIQLSDLLLEESAVREIGTDAKLIIRNATQASYQISGNVDVVSIAFDERLIVEAVRVGNDIILKLSNGDEIRLIDYYDYFELGAGLDFVGLETAAAFATTGGAGAMALAGGIGVAASLAASGGNDDGAPLPTIDPTDGTVLSGTGEPGGVVSITYPGATTPLIARVDPITGLWTVTPNTPIPHGTVLTVTQVGPNGATSEPVIETVNNPMVPPTVDPQNTDDPTPVLTGTAEPGARVQVTVGGATFEVLATNAGTWSVNTQTATPISGNFTSLGVGTHEVEVKAINANGTSAVDPTSNEIVISSGQSGLPVEIIDEPTGGANYGAGDVIRVEMSMGEIVTVAGGTPTVQLNIGGEIVHAKLVSGSGSDKLIFEYTVKTGDADPDGVEVIAGTFNLHGATLVGATSQPLDVTNGTDSSAAFVTDAALPLGFKVFGSNAVFDALETGANLDSAGDVNGDGFEDFILSTPQQPSNNGSGDAYVIFGGGDGLDVDLSNLADSEGFKIVGNSANSAERVTSVGDVNGDGLDDVLVSDVAANKAYIVYGQTAGTGVYLANIASNGVEIFDSRPNSSTVHYGGIGRDVTGLGDVNGDGLADFAITANDDSAMPGGPTGHVHVVYGRTNFGSSYDLANIASDVTEGFSIVGDYYFNQGRTHSQDALGRQIENAGDINGDGYADIMISAPFAMPTEQTGGIFYTDPRPGAAYVVFGGASVGSVDAVDLFYDRTTRGFAITGTVNSSEFSNEFASIGDVNHDGYDDMIFAVDQTLTVVYGRDGHTNVDLANIAGDASLGYVITGFTKTPTHVSDAGDFNGDGVHDFIVGNIGGTGEAFVVFGATGGFDVSTIMDGTANGFAITNNAALPANLTDESYDDVQQFLGEAVASAGDINGDGFDDLLVSAPFKDIYDYNYGYYIEYTERGASYVIFGNDGGDNSPIDLADLSNTTQPMVKVDEAGTTGADVISGYEQGELFVGDLGDDTITGGGGADIILAGAGDDTVIINASNIAALEGGAQFGKLSQMEGGNGTDTLVLAGENLTLDFGNIDFDRVENFEVIDITGSGANTLEIGLEDLLHLSDTSDTFRILGNGDDTIEVSGMSAATLSTMTDPLDGNTYKVYTLGHETLEIHDAIAINLL